MRRTRLFLAAVLAALMLTTASVAGPRSGFSPTTEPVAVDGTKAAVDLPASQHMKNMGGRDGSGLCVFTAAEMAARWQNVGALDGFQTWMTRQLGGGYPQKLDKMIAQFCASKGVPVPGYIQHTGGDESFLDLAIKTSRLVCVTYSGRDDFYRGPIAHMVNLAHIDATHAAIIDNNRPGKWVWMTRVEFLARWRGMGGGWAVAFLNSPPPAHPVPKNANACVCGDDCKCKGGDCPAKCPVMVGQCPNGRCPLVVPSQPIPGVVGGSNHYRDATPPGAPPTDRHEWRPFDDGGYGWRLKEDDSETPNYGIDPSQIRAGKHYTLPSGKEISKGEAKGLLTDLVDDSGRWHLTCVGTAAAQSQFLADVGQLSKSVTDQLHVQCYAPTAWAVSFFALPNGVSLRKPGRASADIGVIVPADYSAVKLATLLASEGGPLYVAPPPAPVPAPDPRPVVPVSPPAPDPDVAPSNPPAPARTPVGSDGLFGLFVALGAIALGILKR